MNISVKKDYKRFVMLDVEQTFTVKVRTKVLMTTGLVKVRFLYSLMIAAIFLSPVFTFCPFPTLWGAWKHIGVALSCWMDGRGHTFP